MCFYFERATDLIFFHNWLQVLLLFPTLHYVNSYLIFLKKKTNKQKVWNVKGQSDIDLNSVFCSSLSIFCNSWVLSSDHCLHWLAVDLNCVITYGLEWYRRWRVFQLYLDDLELWQTNALALSLFACCVTKVKGQHLLWCLWATYYLNCGPTVWKLTGLLTTIEWIRYRMCRNIPINLVFIPSLWVSSCLSSWIVSNQRPESWALLPREVL